MKLYMTIDEIVAFVREAAVPSERVRIAAQMNCCKASVIYEICTAHGLNVPMPKTYIGRKPKLSDEYIELVRRKVESGKTFTVIAREFGVHPSIISYFAKKHGIKKPKKG